MISQVVLAVALLGTLAAHVLTVKVLLDASGRSERMHDRERRILEAQLALALGEGQTVPVALRDEDDSNLKGNTVVDDEVQIRLERSMVPDGEG